MNPTLYTSTIKNIVSETDDSVSIYLDIPSGIGYKPGQFITLHLNIGGEEIKRSYSLSSCPGDDYLRITVKRVKGGLVSNYINEKMTIGDQVSFTAPEGFFTLSTEVNQQPRLFIGAGSGITPIISMLKSSLKNSSAPHILLYGNRDKDLIIFDKEIDQLQQTYSQLAVQRYISKGGLLKKLFTRDKKYTFGRIQPEDVWYSAIDLGESGFDAEYYICGPEGMNKSIKQELLARNVSEDVIKVEFYTAAKISSDAGQSCDALIILEGDELSINIPQGTSVLDALLDEGHDPPHSCTSGACCTCIAKLTDGKVSMERTDALSKSEIKDGFILTCQAIAESEKITVDFNIYE